MVYANALEKQARCEHANLSKEVMYGQRTGDFVCDDCGADITRHDRNNIVPVEYRDEMILTPHALLVSLKANQELHLVKDVEAPYLRCHWALVNSSREIIIPVAKGVVEDCLAKRYVTLPEPPAA